MKRLAIIYNVIFLIAGNSLLSNIHFSHDHSHEYSDHECNECVLIENGNDYILGYHQPLIENSTSSEFILDNIINLILSVKIPSLSRAPPIS